MNKIKWYHIVLLLVLAFISNEYYQSHFSKEAKIREANIENSEKIEIGMTKIEVIDIMGFPNDSIIDKGGLFSFSYNYNLHLDSEPYILVNFDNNDTVTSFFPKMWK